MNSLSNTKYKDELPLNTINRIRHILNDLGFLTIEADWKNSVDGFYSVTIMISNTTLTSNGKGTTYEYALASAYGELIERLQNQAHFRLNMDFSIKALEYRGFYYAPDEKPMSIDGFINNQNDWIKAQLSLIKSDINIKDLLNKWKLVSYEDTSFDFITLPYFNLKTKNISYIPIKMISKMYMSNGMCAGNTPEEALVQGISEILERNVNIRIIKEKIVPPTIPDKYIEKFPKTASMIAKIKAKGNYDVILKDCSLGQGFPVVGVIFINKDDQTYFIKFGAHPIFEIAVERTLTELLQGQDIMNMMGVKEYSYKNHVLDESDNLMGILVNGSGYYPSEFFSTNFSYAFNEFESLQKPNNKQLLQYLLRLIEEKGFNIFIRNVSFLGFSSFHVIVPGLSEIENMDDVKAIDDYAEYVHIKKHIRNLDNLSDTEIDAITAFFNKRHYNANSSITDLLNLSIKTNSLPWYYDNINLFLTALNYKKENFACAYSFFDKFMENIQPNSSNQHLFTFYKCVRDYIGARIDNLTNSDIYSLLNLFYPSDMITGVISEFENPKQILTNYKQLNCWNCNSCKYKAHCSYTTLEKIYMTLKDKYILNPLNQYDLVKLLEL